MAAASTKPPQNEVKNSFLYIPLIFYIDEHSSLSVQTCSISKLIVC